MQTMAHIPYHKRGSTKTYSSTATTKPKASTQAPDWDQQMFVQEINSDLNLKSKRFIQKDVDLAKNMISSYMKV